MTTAPRNSLKLLSQSEELMRTPSPRGWISTCSAVAAAAFALLGVACGGAASDGPVDTSGVTGATHATIYSGTADNDESSNGSVVSLKIGGGSSFELCSGALVAPNVVLTARHCVSQNLTATVSCDENGKSGNGAHAGGDEDPASIHVYLGAKPNFGKGAASKGRAIFHPAGGVLCNADIALLVLDTPITSVPTIKVRLSGATHTTETVRSVGFGQNDASLPVGTRLRKDNVPVLAVGQALSKSQTPLGSHEFEVGLSICQGDSGGPAISETTGAVIGVVSRGGGCSDDFGHIYTSTIGFGELFTQAFAMAGGAPVDEGGLETATTADRGEGAAAASPSKLDGAGSGACSARVASASEVNGWGLGAALAAFGLLIARRRRGADAPRPGA